MRFKCVFVLLFVVQTYGKIIIKRQLFREQLMPHLGGKVPESAFWADRLALNHLNSRGIYSSTGVYFEHSRDDKNHAHLGTLRSFLKVHGPMENRYVAPPGRYHPNSPETYDTTYPIIHPVNTANTAIKPNLLQPSHPLIPYTSLKLVRYYNQKKKNRSKDELNEVNNDFILQAKEFEPYLKKLHEMD